LFVFRSEPRINSKIIFILLVNLLGRVRHVGTAIASSSYRVAIS
jgi:hypothetical protein